jgi:hypothetical protein
MEGMVLVSKVNNSAGSSGLRRGRPKRTGFSIRRYGKIYKLTIPSGLSDDIDRIHFFLSQDGFAISLTPSGERAISGGTTNRTATIPRVISKNMTKANCGVTELFCKKYSDRTWYFPFDQFQPLQPEGNPLPVDHPTTLMEQ